MRHLLCGLAFFVVFVPALPAQQAPTLGPQRPSLAGPGNVRTVNARRLAHMKKVYIEWIDNKLNEKLTDDLSHISWLKVVNKQQEADAIIRGTCFSLRRLKQLHAEIYISDRVSGKPIWQDVIRVPYGPPDLTKAVDQAATEILAHLNQSIHQAAR